MYMAYDKKTWATRETINTSELNHMEQGIEDAHTALDEIQAAVESIPDMFAYMQTVTYDPDEDGKVDSAEIADTLANGESPKSYANISSEIDADITTHASNASAHHAKYTDAEAIAAVNGDVTHGSSASHNYRTDEEIMDVCSSMLTAGSNVTLTYDDNANTLTVAAIGLTPEQQSKLYGIEEGATADLTAEEIVALINASEFTIDADNIDISGAGLTPDQLAKLTGIEEGATADLTATEIVALINASSEVIDSANLNQSSLSTVLERGFVGEVVVGDSLRIYNPRAGTILSATVISSTKPSGESLMVDVRKNGTATTNSIFTSDTPMILGTSTSLTNGVYVTNGILDAAQVSLAPGDVLRAYVTQTGNTADVSVCLEVLY